MSKLKEILDNASIETDSKKPISVKYQQPETMEVDIDVPNIRGNRTPIDYMKYLEMQGGFDWSMWRKPYVVEVSAAAGREWVDSLPADKQSHFEKGFVAIEGYGMVFRVMFDGGHRRELHKLAFPGYKTWKCDIYKVETVKEAHIQFVKIQSELQRKLHADLLFVQSYYGGDTRVSKLVDLLKYTGLVVQYEDDVVGEESLNDFSKPDFRGCYTACLFAPRKIIFSLRTFPDKLNEHSFGGIKFSFSLITFFASSKRLFLFIICLSSFLKNFNGTASIGDVAVVAYPIILKTLSGANSGSFFASSV